jgi:hypothetical protein
MFKPLDDLISFLDEKSKCRHASATQILCARRRDVYISIHLCRP